MNILLSTFDFRLSTRASRGFTLIEMIVSLGLFTIIMFIATSAFLSVVNADRKARAVRIAVDNLNIALEDMSRRIKTGTAYYCGTGASSGSTNDCTATPATAFSFDDQSSTQVLPIRVVYKLETNPANCSGSPGCIVRSINAGTATQITSPEIKINGLKFIVSGSASFPEKKQPMVVIVIDGSLGSGTASSTFKIQTTVTQRAYDN